MSFVVSDHISPSINCSKWLLGELTCWEHIYSDGKSVYVPATLWVSLSISNYCPGWLLNAIFIVNYLQALELFESCFLSNNSHSITTRKAGSGWMNEDSKPWLFFITKLHKIRHIRFVIPPFTWSLLCCFYLSISSSLGDWKMEAAQQWTPECRGYRTDDRKWRLLNRNKNKINCSRVSECCNSWTCSSYSESITLLGRKLFHLRYFWFSRVFDYKLVVYRRFDVYVNNWFVCQNRY